MTNLKRAFFWATLYLAIIFILGEFDYSNRPIINFASYFYVVVMVAVPTTLFFPSITRTPVYIPLFVWAAVYLVILQTVDRDYSSNTGEFSVIVLEFILMETGAWLAYLLAFQIRHAESIMDTLALSAFPSRVHDIDLESHRIKIEFTRSRRYHRPLSLFLIQARPNEQKNTQEVLKSIQQDLIFRFTTARVAQIIDDHVRQTDLVLKDQRGRFIVLCPETDRANAGLLAARIAETVEAQTDLYVLCGVASFPEEALTFDELLHKARERLAAIASMPREQIPAFEEIEGGSNL